MDSNVRFNKKKYTSPLLKAPRVRYDVLYIFVILLILLISPCAYAINVSACYRVEILFFKVGESCISFQEENDIVSVKSFMRTVNIGSLAKRVEDKGEGIIKKGSLKPMLFKFYQEEGKFKRYQEYKYIDDKIHVRETKYVGLSDKIEKDEKKVYLYNNFGDPYAVAMYLFENIDKNKSGTLRLFYDDKYYHVPFSIQKEENISIDDIRYDTYKVIVKPNIQGKGLLKPKGDWILWIDKKSRLPVKMSVSFIIGSVNVLVESLKIGDGL